jgi:2-keto-4-pentenoate hydratase
MGQTDRRSVKAMTSEFWRPMDLEDERIAAGVARLQRARAGAVAAGAAHIGWKVGWNDPAFRTRFGLRSGVVGHLLDTTVIRHDRHDLRGATRAGGEYELAVRMRTDVFPGDDGHAAIGAVAPAIEVLDVAVLDVEAAVAVNVWHRAAIVGAETPYEAAMLDGLEVAVSKSGSPPAELPRVYEAIAVLPEVLRFVADGAVRSGDRLRAGHLVMCGNLAPGIAWVHTGDHLHAAFGRLGSVEVHFESANQEQPQ